MSDFSELQATITGMSQNGAGAETVFGMFDHETGVLLLDGCRTEKPGVKAQRGGDSAVVINDPRLGDYDVVLEEDHIRDAIGAYFSIQSSGLLKLTREVERHAPQSAIEHDGIDDKGTKYRVSPSITNGQMAVIALCWLAKRQDSVEAQLGGFDELPGLDVLTIGLPTEYRAGTPSLFGGHEGVRDADWGWSNAL